MESFKPPEALEIHSGNVSENWNKWQQRFDLYFRAVGADAQPAARQCAIFLHVIGSDALDVYNTWEFDDEAERNDLGYSELSLLPTAHLVGM